MAPRRSHKKSRLGCDQCKARRVKCNEQGPPCNNCTAREISCNYSVNVRLTSNDRHCMEATQSRFSQDASPNMLRHPLTNRASTSPDDSFLPTSALIRDRLLELELMHHFSTKTCLTFSHQQGQGATRRERERELLQDFLPSEALRYDFLLTAVLAMAALHKASIVEPHQSSFYLKIALEYQGLSQAAFHVALQHLNKDNCHAILAASLGFFVLGIAMPRRFAGAEDRGGAKASLLSILKLFKGPWDIFELYRETLMAGPFGISFTPKVMSAYKLCDVDTKEALDRLLTLNEQSAVDTQGEALARNSHIINQLESGFRRMHGGVNAAVFGWLSIVPKSFIADVGRNEAVSCLIFMHWGVLLNRSDDVWWSLKSGRALIDELSVALDSLGPLYHESVAWCRQQVGLPITANESTEPGSGINSQLQNSNE